MKDITIEIGKLRVNIWWFKEQKWIGAQWDFDNPYFKKISVQIIPCLAMDFHYAKDKRGYYRDLKSGRIKPEERRQPKVFSKQYKYLKVSFCPWLKWQSWIGVYYNFHSENKALELQLLPCICIAFDFKKGEL